MRKAAMKDVFMPAPFIRKGFALLQLLLFCILSLTVYSQKVTTLISKDKIVIGEQVTLQIKVEGITPGDIQQDFSFPDTVNHHLEILYDSVEQVNTSTLLHTLTLTSFDSGYWQLPSFKLILSNQKIIATEPVDIAVLPVDVSNLQDYHDIKDILDIRAENNWWVIASIVLTGLISLFALLWFMNSKPVDTPQNIISPANLRQLYEALLERLGEIENIGITNNETAVAVFSEASQSTRNFIDKIYHQDTAHLTTGEYMLQQKGKLPNIEIENSYFQFLRLADAVKFAKYLPPAPETQIVFPVLKKIITSVYQQLKPVS